jgi:hypothetical protein
VRRIPPFVYGHVLGALLIGLVAGSFLDLKAVMTFGGAMAAGALVSAIICRRWPGFAGPGWQLWIVAVVGNPLFLAAAFFAWQDIDCLLGTKTGWGCMFAGIEPLVMAVCFAPPLVGLAVRWLATRRAKSV